MQTITEMFKRQKKANCDAATKREHESVSDEDDDVLVVEEETLSPYFSKSVSSEVKMERNSRRESGVKGAKSKTNLSLKRKSNVSTESTGDVKIRKSVKMSGSTHDAIEKQNPFLAASPDVNVNNCFLEEGLLKAEDAKISEKNSSNDKIYCEGGDDVKAENSKREVVQESSERCVEKNMVMTKRKAEDNTYSATALHKEPKESLENPTDEFLSNGEENSSETFRIPYYLQNFNTILQSVLDDDSNTELFDDDDMKTLKAYQQLSEPAKKLYVRMFSRKFSWIPLSKLNYTEIAENLEPFLEELQKAMLINNEEKLTDLEEVLNALSASDIKSLAKSYHITSTAVQKNQLVQELLKKTQQSTISSMFGSKTRGISEAMLVKAKKFINGMYRLIDDARRVFVRVMMLFSLVNTSGDEDSGNGGQGQLFQMLMVNMGKVVYPQFSIDKSHKIFRNRDDVIRFEHALQLESDLLLCTQKGNWEKAFIVYESVVQELDKLEADVSIVEWNKNLPDFLRAYTASSVLYRLMNIGIEILQRRKEFTKAVDLLRKLLAQRTYISSYRGYWWERLALNLDAHLKKTDESLNAIAEGLNDECVRVGHRLALYQRAEAICQRPKLKLKHKLKTFHHKHVKEMPKVYIEGRVLHEGVGTTGMKFLTEESYSHGNAQDMTVCGVEEFVMSYYRKNGFPSGIHAEGSVMSSLFSLFFWDVLFMSLPDAFHSPYQAQPLDLYSDAFYVRRKEVIEQRLQHLEECSVQDLQNLAEESWNSHHGVLCVGLGWDRVRSIEVVKELLGCMGGKILSGLVGRYARCPRHTRSGFPDLTLWNAQTGKLKICEVKGPGDRLSHKQILWIDYLLDLGVDAEVCHVKAVAAKKLKVAS